MSTFELNVKTKKILHICCHSSKAKNTFLYWQPGHPMMWRGGCFWLAVCLQIFSRVEWKWHRLFSSGRKEFLHTKFSSNSTHTQFDLCLWIFFNHFSFNWFDHVECAVRANAGENHNLRQQLHAMLKRLTSSQTHSLRRFTTRLQARLRQQWKLSVFVPCKLHTELLKTLWPANCAGVFSLLTSTKLLPFYMMVVKHNTSWWRILTITIISSKQCYLSHFAVQIDGGFSFLEVDQNEET